MTKYKITIERSQNGKVLERIEQVVESSRKPKIGEGFNQLIDPPIKNVIVEVEELIE